MLVLYYLRNILSKQNQDTWWLIWRLSYINVVFTRISLATSIKKKIKTSCCGFLSFFAKNTVATESVFAINFLISLFTLVYLNHYFNFFWPLRITTIVRLIYTHILYILLILQYDILIFLVYMIHNIQNKSESQE